MSIKRTLGLTGVLIVFLGGVAAYASYDSFGSGVTYNQTKTADGSNITSIMVQVPGVDVNVTPTDSQTFTAHFYGQGPRDYVLNLTNQNGQLQCVIDQPDGPLHWDFSLFNRKMDLDLSVPKKVYDQFKAQSSSGNIQFAQGVQANLIELHASSGNIDFPQFQGQKLMASTSSGNLNIANATGNIDLQTSSGDIKAHDLQVSHLLANTSSGDMTFHHISGDTNLSTSSGTVKLQDLNASHLTTSSSSGDLELMNVSGAAVNAHSSSGDVTLGLLDLKQDVTINTSSGDAKVYLPASLAFGLHYHTGSGDAKVDFPITYQVQDKHNWQGTVDGGGSMLNVQTSSGNLSILSK